MADVEKDGKNMKINILSVIESFGRMSKSDKDEYLKLFNKYTDSRTQKFYFTPTKSELKSDFVDLKTKLLGSIDGPNNKFLQQFVLEYGEQGFIEVIGIYYTNCFANGLGIKAARFNHSCCSNANLYVVDEECPNHNWLKMHLLNYNSMFCLKSKVYNGHITLSVFFSKDIGIRP